MQFGEKCFTCRRGGLTIRGMQYFPDNFQENQKYPPVILSHGFTDNYRNTADYCRFFAQMGYIAFGFSFCGGGSLQEDKSAGSDGKTTDMTLSTEVEDLISVKNYVQGLPWIDAKRLILAGYSQGGFVSGLAAARCKDEVKRLIMISPALCIPDDAIAGRLGGSRYDPGRPPETIDCGKTLLGPGFHEEASRLDPWGALASYRGPVLLFHGLEDRIVHYSYALHARDCYREGQCRLQLLRGTGHGYDGTQKKSIFASIRQFLADRWEILTLRVIITHTESFVEGDVHGCNIFFTGYCDTEYFQGTVLPGGCDVREQRPGGETKIRAEYTLSGRDFRGEKCSLHIVNQKDGMDWKPVIETDSRALDWLNRADLTAVPEDGDGGPTVRIFAKLPHPDLRECD